MRAGVKQLSRYELQSDDRIIYENEGIFSRDVVVAAAADGFPGKTAGFRDDHWYIPRAIIARSGEFITWGDRGEGDRTSADLVIANSLVESKADLRLLARRLGQFSLRGMLNVNWGLTTYLEDLAVSRGVNYMPATDPFSRYDEFDT
jgi:hypothetical protein